jgi:hypothetical protein
MLKMLVYFFIKLVKLKSLTRIIKATYKDKFTVLLCMIILSA